MRNVEKLVAAVNSMLHVAHTLKHGRSFLYIFKRFVLFDLVIANETVKSCQCNLDQTFQYVKNMLNLSKACL